MLISSLIGVDKRGTKDLDTTIQGFTLTHESAEKAFREIAAVDVDDDFEPILHLKNTYTNWPHGSKSMDMTNEHVPTWHSIRKEPNDETLGYIGQGHDMARLKTMTTQFIDGASNGVRICRCTLSTMTTVFVPRPLLARAKQVSDLPLRGIYYLINDEDGAISRLYVGQTKQGIARLDDHNAKKDFWNKAILFLSDDIQSFSLDNVSALEKYAIEQASASKRYTVENKVDPRYVIDQYQKPTIEQIYEEIAFVMGTFGYQIEGLDDALANVKLFFTSRRGVRARGVFNGDTFDVLEGSPVDLSMQPKLDRYEKMRQELLADGSIVRESDSMGRLAKTVQFSTPSGAADFVLGGSNNGWIEWKDADKQTLDALYRK